MDCRADQFSFCVTAYELLLGVRSPSAKRCARSGPISRPPRAVVRALLKGMSARAVDRHADMAALLGALSPRRSRVPLIAAGIAVVAVMGGAWSWLVSQRAERVRAGAMQAIAEVWHDGRAAEIDRVFEGTGHAHARRIAADVDRLVRKWSALWLDAQLAASADLESGRYSAAVFDRRVACLDERRAQLDALVGLFRRADYGLVNRAAELTKYLESGATVLHAHVSVAR